MLPKISPTSMTQPCRDHPVRSGWYRPLAKKRLRNRYLPKARVNHVPLITADEYAQRRSKDYEQAFARLSSEDRAFLRQAKVVIDERPTLEQRFNEQAEKWDLETGHLSSPSQRIMHPSYQAILGMGQQHRDEVIRLLIKDMKTNRRHWFWALSYLAQTNPIKPEDAGRIDRMIDAWVRWDISRRKP